MRNDEFGNYGISNPDGRSVRPSNEGKFTFANDKSNYIEEDTSRTVKENSYVPEGDYATPSASRSAGRASGGSEGPLRSASNSVTLTASSPAVGSGLGAALGVVATAVVAAVVVVSTILNILSVNVSLLLADVDRLVFQMEVEVEEIEGEGEAEMPVFTATLKSGDGYLEERLVSGNSIFSFEGLEPNKEYFLTVKGEDGKIYVDESYCTAAIPKRTAFLETFSEHGEVYLYVGEIELSKGEIYTVTAKDDDGRVVFAADSDKEDSFSFRLARETGLFVTLRVGNEILAAERVEVWLEPEPQPEPELVYQYANAVWTWNGTDSVTVTVPEANGGDPLILSPQVTFSETPATCETDGERVYSAVIVDQNAQQYHDEKVVVLSALGHALGDLHEGFAPTCEEQGLLSYYECAACGKYFDVGENEIGESDLTLAALGHSLGALVQGTPATCETDGAISYSECTVCGKLFDTDGNEVGSEDLVLPAFGHDYGDPTFIWTPVYEQEQSGAAVEENSVLSDTNEMTPIGFTAVLRCVCKHDSSHIVEKEASVDSFSTPGTCDTDGYTTYTASAVWDNEEYDDEYVYVYEGSAHGHTYGDLIEEEPATCEESGRAAHYQCSECGKYFDSGLQEISEEDLTIPPSGHDYGDLSEPIEATCEENGMIAYYCCSKCEKYFNENYEELEEAEFSTPPLGHDYGEPEFCWMEDENAEPTNDDPAFIATAIFTCARNSEHFEEMDCVVTSEASGNTWIYTATIVFEDHEYTDTKTMDEIYEILEG